MERKAGQALAGTFPASARSKRGARDATEVASRPLRDVVVVDIDEASFRDVRLFRGRSHLDADAIARVVRNIASHRPRTIVLDLLIHPSPSDRGDLKTARLRLYGALDSLVRAGIPIVLAMDKLEVVEGEPIDPELAGTWEHLIRADSTRAAPLIAADGRFHLQNGLVRAASVVGEVGRDGRHALSVLSATAYAAQLRLRPNAGIALDDAAVHSQWRLRFSSVYSQESEQARGSGVAAREVEAVLPASSPKLLTNKIVVVGGTFHEARGEVLTSAGSARLVPQPASFSLRRSAV